MLACFKTNSFRRFYLNYYVNGKRQVNMGFVMRDFSTSLFRKKIDTQKDRKYFIEKFGGV